MEDLKAYLSELVDDRAKSGTIRTEELAVLLSRLEQAEMNADTYQTLYEQRAESLEQAEQAVQRVRAMAQDWEANGNSCAVGDRSADVWHATANAILRALDGDR